MTDDNDDDYRVDPFDHINIVTDIQTAENVCYVLKQAIQLVVEKHRKAETWDEQERWFIIFQRLLELRAAFDNVED